MPDCKLGILTFHSCINYGSFWQAYLLADGLQKLGVDAQILNHQTPRVHRAEWRCAMQPVLPTPVPRFDYAAYKTKIRRFLHCFTSLPLSKPFNLDNPADMEEFDVILVGSDEVWNLFHPWYGHHQAFYGAGLKADRLVGYAASFGNYPSDYTLDPFWKERLRSFDLISVRDKNSAQLVQQATGSHPELILDPCLQFPDDPDANPYPKSRARYVALYGHNFPEYFVAHTRKWAADHNLPIISIGYRNDWADRQWLTADPFDFSHFMKHAEIIVTNFFHGCVFALRNERPFICTASSYRSNKILDLLEITGAEHHFIDENRAVHEIEELLDTPLDGAIVSRIEGLRDKSNRFMHRALMLSMKERANEIG